MVRFYGLQGIYFAKCVLAVPIPEHAVCRSLLLHIVESVVLGCYRTGFFPRILVNIRRERRRGWGEPLFGGVMCEDFLCLFPIGHHHHHDCFCTPLFPLCPHRVFGAGFFRRPYRLHAVFLPFYGGVHGPLSGGQHTATEGRWLQLVASLRATHSIRGKSCLCFSAVDAIEKA